MFGYPQTQYALGHQGNPQPDKVVWFDDFLALDLDTTNGIYRFDLDNSGTRSLLDYRNGAIRLSAAAGVNSGAMLQGRNEVFATNEAKAIGFAWRGRLNIGASVLGAIGLSEVLAIHIWEAATFESDEFIGFRVRLGRLEALCVAGGNATVVDLQAVPADGTEFTLGFEVESRNVVRFYVNSTLVTEIVTNIPAEAQGLAVTIGALHAAGNANARIDTDLVMAVQDR